jgi:anti-sigma factor RsiW
VTCKETQTFMDGYLDGELDLVRSIDLERHLHDCPACGELHKARTTVRAAIGASPLRYHAPSGLKQSVHAALLEQARKETKPERKWFQLQWPALAATAAAVIVAVLWLRPIANPLERDVVDSHIRSLMANHLMDVPSTDQHTVKPWFAGKLDFSPPVRDFSSDGFPLTGGRLDYLDHRPVAALVYRRNQHIINVFMWPDSSGDRKFHSSAQQGYNVIETVRNGVEYWLVSDLNHGELQQLADRITAK